MINREKKKREVSFVTLTEGLGGEKRGGTNNYFTISDKGKKGKKKERDNKSAHHEKHQREKRTQRKKGEKKG